MKHFRRFLFVHFAAIACTHATAQLSLPASNAAAFKACAVAPKAKGACPVDAVFGLFKLAPNNAILDFKVSSTVPRVVNQTYGWMAKLNQKSGNVRVLERMTLPEAPKS